MAKTNHHGRSVSGKTLVTAMGLLCVGVGCGGAQSGGEWATVPEIRPGLLAGYLSPEAYPDSLALLPPPPAEGSTAFALDVEVSGEAGSLRGTERWDQAALDAELMFPAASGAFECALGVAIDEETTPRLYMLLRRSLADAGLTTYAAKNHHARARPFTVNGEPTCTPDEEEALRGDGSYPSGHTAVGWAWALILAELSPDRADAILSRGLAFGESRVICNVHWPSDVLAGRVVGAAVVATLHANADFEADLDAARSEIVAAHEAGRGPGRRCASGESLDSTP